MPWCDTCGRFWNPTSMPATGACPTCGRVIATAVRAAPRAPWHFKALVASAAVYLGWRAVQGVAWVIARLA